MAFGPKMSDIGPELWFMLAFHINSLLSHSRNLEKTDCNNVMFKKITAYFEELSKNKDFSDDNFYRIRGACNMCTAVL